MLNRQATGEWRIERTNGETIVVEADTEREALLLARESFPDDERFDVTLQAQRCPRCRTRVTDTNGFRCESCTARREARKRTFLVRVKFLVRQGWTREYEVRAKAFSLVGATALGVREARRDNLPRGTRVAQASVQVVAVKGSAR